MVYHKCDTSAENQNNTQDSQNKFIIMLNYLKEKRIVIRSILEIISYNIQVCILYLNKCHIFLNSNARVRNKRH